MRKSFQFTVAGDKQTGVVYVTMDCTDVETGAAKAAKIAAKRSGDPAPVFVRAVAPRR